MSESRRRHQRVASLASLAVGPVTFDVNPEALLLLARADLATARRFFDALQDLVGNGRLYETVSSLPRETLDQVGWIVVTHVKDGGQSFRLLTRDAEAAELVVGQVMAGLVERGLRWSTLVFGSPADIESFRAMAAPLRPRLPQPGETRPAPQIEVLSSGPPGFRIIVDKADVERRDLRAVLFGLDSLTDDWWLSKDMSSFLEVTFSGYDDDPRFVGAIPEVVAYLRAVDLHAPWAFVLGRPASYMLWCLVLDDEAEIIFDVGGTTSVYLTPESITRIQERLKWTTAHLWSEQLMSQGPVHPALLACVKNWVDFLATGRTAEQRGEGDITARHLAEDDAADPEPRDVAPAANEQDFWKSMVQTIAPGWVVDFRPTPAQPTPSIANLDCWIYGLDVRSGWVCGAGFAPADVKLILEEGSQPHRGEAAVALAAETLMQLGKEGAPVSDDRARLSLVASLVALGETQLLSRVVQLHGSPTGHFIYMVYGLEDGNAFARSAYAEDGASGPMSLEDVLGLAALTIASDTSKHDGVVGAMIRRGGGLAMAPNIRALVAGT